MSTRDLLPVTPSPGAPQREQVYELHKQAHPGKKGDTRQHPWKLGAPGMFVHPPYPHLTLICYMQLCCLFQSHKIF